MFGQKQGEHGKISGEKQLRLLRKELTELREIKFRQYVWDNDDKSGPGRMVDWNEMLAEEGESLSCCFRFEFSNASPLMQFTGLKDKNGREIYEGDIVTGNWYSYEEPTSCVTGIVEYWQGWCAFIIHDAEMKVLAEMNGHGAYHFEFEVIGNVYENPELLKGAD